MNRIHRWSGRLAVLATIPVAFHCIFILGFQTTDARVFAHFAARLVRLRRPGSQALVRPRPRPSALACPACRGTLFTILAALWSTSSLWYFTEVEFGF